LKGMTLKSFMIRDSLFDILRFNIVLVETIIKALFAISHELLQTLYVLSPCIEKAR